MLVGFLIFWVRFTFPRFREDQLQAFAWKYLIPISLRQHPRHHGPEGGVLMPKVPGLFTGMRITFGELLKTLFPRRGIKTLIPAPVKHGAVTVQYPHENEAPAPRARGVIALKSENCTVCMLCSRSCPDWCIYIEGHKTKAPPRRPGGKERTVSALDRFDIDYALCMYCGICVEVCPFDALFWSPEYEYSETRLADLLHDEARLNEWMETVPDFEAYEAGSDAKVRKVPR